MNKVAFPFLFLLLLSACSSSNDSDNTTEEPLMEVTHEVIYFMYTPDTGNETSKLEYQIKFSNPNGVTVNGFPSVTINTDGTIASSINSDENECYTIEANSDCLFTREDEALHILGIPNSIELVEVMYNLDLD